MVTSSAQQVGRYVLFDSIATGGMASVHLARMAGAMGFAKTVAIKRLHPHLATDPDFVAMFIDEAHLAARIHHPNVVPTLDVVAEGEELFLVMEYVTGASLSRLARASRASGIPLAVAISVTVGALHGLHAAHEARSEKGELLQLVHRDVSPQNILVGADGVARVVDFGVAKATARLQTTRDGAVKGKLSYMAPEQLKRAPVDRRADVYGAAVVLWELLAGRRMYASDQVEALVAAVLTEPTPELPAGLPAELVDTVMRALDKDPTNRPATALEFARELQRIVPPAPPDEVSRWVSDTMPEELASLATRIAEIESLEPSDLSKARVKGMGWRERDALVEAPTSKGPVTSNRRIGALLAVGVVVVVGGGAAFAIHRVSTDIAASASSSIASTSGSLAAAPIASIAPSIVEAPAPSPSVAVTPPPRVKPIGAAPPAAIATHRAPTASPCDPPTYVDSSGIKRIKPECQ